MNSLSYLSIIPSNTNNDSQPSTSNSKLLPQNDPPPYINSNYSTNANVGNNNVNVNAVNSRKNCIYLILRKILQLLGLKKRERRFILNSVSPDVITDEQDSSNPPSYNEAISSSPKGKSPELPSSAQSSTTLTPPRPNPSPLQTPSSTTTANNASLISRLRSTSISLSRKSSQLTIQASNSVTRKKTVKPKTLVLDLDETLIHSTSNVPLNGGKVKGLKTRVIEVVIDGRSMIYHVYKRPGVDFFLKKVSTWYTVVIFTASMREYADPVIDWLDEGRGIVGGRYFRETCTLQLGQFVKDLSRIEPDLKKVCLVDNSPISYLNHQANAIPISGWINDPKDRSLEDLLPLLDCLRFTHDVRRVLGLRGFGIEETSQSGGRRRE